MTGWNPSHSLGHSLWWGSDNEHFLWMRRHGANVTTTDVLPADMEPLIREYWKQFRVLSPEWFFALGICITALGLISLTGNSVVIYIFLTTKSLRTPSNLLVVNLAFSDFMMMFTMMPMMSVCCFSQSWIFGPLACGIYGAFGSGFGSISIISMMAIAIDRYRVIVKGLSGERLTYREAVLWICIIWIFVGLWTAAPFFGWNSYVPEGNLTSCSIDMVSHDWNSRSYVIAYGTSVYLLPLLFLSYTYFYIVKTVVEHEYLLRKQARRMNVDRLKPKQPGISVEAKISLVALMTVVLWFVAWTPYAALAILGSLTNGKLVTPLISIWGAVFAKAGSCYNPIVYAISHPKYQEALRKRLPRLYKFFSCTSSKPLEKVENQENQHESTTIEKIISPESSP
ncbi:ocellar opsin-like [Limulus polyphemus]|uniref:Ocellar opsin-like n=1 Tax=Limulus polyphemus TaxID=6850 RepID=A0A097J9H2_LIMPO|nr:ocellar opsin-like [Limulus polyphemus]AIT75830.1 opsin 6 [Limulus polyphemus]